MAKPIIINQWTKGMGVSAFTGFQEIRCLNITDKPGVIYPNYASLEDDSGGVIATLLVDLAYDLNNWWGHDGTGKKVFERTGTDTWVSRTGHAAADIQGIFNYKGYMGIIQDDDIGWFGVSDSAFDLTWSNAITAGGTIKPSIIAQDDKVYIGSGNKIDSIAEDTDFDPNTGATYTVTKAAVDLPEGENCHTILEMGDFLWLVCKHKIYPWDKSSDSFNSPVVFNKEINQAIVFNNTMYVQAGIKGEWYVTRGTSVQLFAKIPDTLTDINSGTVTVFKPAIHNDLIYFGVGHTTTTFNPQGVYSLNPNTGALTIEHLISTNGYGKTNTIQFGRIASLSETTESASGIIIPWTENSVSKTDILQSSIRYTSDRAFFITDLMSVGSAGNLRGFNKPEIILSKPLAANDSLKVYYREVVVKNDITITDDWINTTVYSVGDVRTVSLKDNFVCIVAHTSAFTDRPGSGVNWETKWVRSWELIYNQSTDGFISGIMNAIPSVKNLQLMVVLNLGTELQKIILDE